MVALTVMVGCGADHGSTETGQVRFALAASGGGGTGTTPASSFVLANASFQVTGPTNTFTLGPSDPTAADLTVTVPVGRYTVTLLPGWQIEKAVSHVQSTMVDLTPVEATLQSTDTVTVSVFSGQTASVTFQFQTSGIPLTFGPGAIDIGAQITPCDPQPPPGVELNVVANHDFETNADGWRSPPATPLVLSDVAHCGRHSGQVPASAYFAEYPLPNPGTRTTYAISAWVLEGDAASAEIAADEQTDGTSRCTLHAVSVTTKGAPSSGWVQLSAVLTIGGLGCTLAALVVDGPPAPFLLDDVYAIPQ